MINTLGHIIHNLAVLGYGILTDKLTVIGHRINLTKTKLYNRIADKLKG